MYYTQIYERTFLPGTLRNSKNEIIMDQDKICLIACRTGFRKLGAVPREHLGMGSTAGVNYIFGPFISMALRYNQNEPKPGTN
jgi:hypothetical protein